MLDSTDLQADDETSARAPTPPPAIPAPPPAEFAYDLAITEQFQYVKPVLEATLQGLYGPSQNRHALFMRGAKYRQQVCNDAAIKGDLRNAELEELNGLIWRWIWRKELRGELSTKGPGVDGRASGNHSNSSISPNPGEKMPPVRYARLLDQTQTANSALNQSSSGTTTDVHPPLSQSSSSDTEV